MNKVLEINHDTCRSRSDIRSAKDVCRMSTSSLSKKELEDLYYSIIDNNLELKRTVNNQKDQIKVLTTRISRLTQKNIYSPLKGCNKNTLNEHKEIIIDLKQANEKLVERVRLLNMQLCSAKQFVKRNPLQSSRCRNCANIRNSSSITLLNSKRSQLNLRIKSTASQYEHDITPIILEETIKESVPTKDQEECTQNKCKTAIEELQHKIQELEKDLSIITEQYKNGSKKYTDYENVVSNMKEENLKIRSQVCVCEEKLEVQRKEYHELLKKLRSVEAQNESVSLELILEKQKTRELETQLKAAEISHNIVQALSQAVRVNQCHEPVRDESLLPMRADDSFTSKRVDESLISVKVDESLISSRVDDPLISKVVTLTPVRAKSLIPVRVNESLTPLRDETTEKIGDSRNKVEQSDDSGYLEATNKFLEQSCCDITLDKIMEYKDAKDEKTITVSDDYKRKKRKGKSRKNKRDSSRESSVDGNLSRMSSNDVSENRVDKDSNITEDIEQPRKNIEDSARRILKDVGVQSTAEYVSRAVGDIVVDRTDAEVQIGDSLCAMPDIDTRTYSRKSNRTYSVHPEPIVPADNTEREISSLSDLPSERELTPSDYISPGEAVSSSEYSASWSELSEGELPIPRHKLSYGEVDASTSIGEHKPSISPERLNRAMRAAKEEADRVARLLDGRPVDLPGGTVNPLVLLRARY